MVFKSKVSVVLKVIITHICMYVYKLCYVYININVCVSVETIPSNLPSGPAAFEPSSMMIFPSLDSSCTEPIGLSYNPLA